MLADCGKPIVRPLPERGGQGIHHTSEGAIRLYQGSETAGAEDEGEHEGQQHPVAEQTVLLAETEAEAVLLAQTAPEPGNRVLKYAQRAYYRTVNPAEHEGEQQQGRNDDEIQGQNGREKLHFRHPAKPCVDAATEVEKQQSNCKAEKNGESRPDFSKHITFILAPYGTVPLRWPHISDSAATRLRTAAGCPYIRTFR